MSGGVEHQHLEEAEDEFGSGRGFETLSASTPNHSDGNREIDSELRPGKSDLGERGGITIHYFSLFLQSGNCGSQQNASKA